MSKAEDRDFGQFREYCCLVIRFLKTTLLHDHFDVKVIHCSSADSNDTETTKASMSCRINPPYLYMTLLIYPQAYEQWKSGNRRQVALDLLHECCHLFFEELFRVSESKSGPAEHPYIVNILERNTQLLSYVVDILLPKGWHEAVLEKRRPRRRHS